MRHIRRGANREALCHAQMLADHRQAFGRKGAQPRLLSATNLVFEQVQGLLVVGDLGLRKCRVECGTV